MTTFYKVKSNVKHNGDTYKQGSIIEGAEFSGMPDFFEMIMGAETLEEAQAILAETQAVEPKTAPEQAEKNTWGPTDQPEAPTPPTGDKPEVYTGPMVKVKFLQDYEIVNENNEKTGEILSAGTEAEIPEPTVSILVENGIVEVDASVGASDQTNTGDVPPADDADNTSL